MADREIDITVRIKNETSEFHRQQRAQFNATTQAANRAAKQQTADAKRAAKESAQEWMRADAERLKEFRRVQAEKARDQKRAESDEKRSALASAREWSRSGNEMLRDFRRVQAEKLKIQREADREMTRNAKRRAKEDKDFSDSMARSQGRIANASRESYTNAIGMGVAAGGAAVGFQKILDTVMKLPKALEDARLASQKLGGDFGDKREQLAELAVTKGRNPDNAFVQENALFNRKAGFRFDEGLQFRNAFAGTGEQYKGTKIDKKEFGRFEEQSAKLTLAKAIDPELGGNFAGGLLGVKDYTKFGAKGPEEALADYNASVGILAAGKGKMSVLLGQLEEVNSALTNDDAMRGLIRDPKQAAMLVSTMAEFNPSESAQMTRSALMGLVDENDPKTKPLLEKAKITRTHMPKFDAIEALKKLQPVVDEEAAKTGKTTTEVLSNYFPDIRKSLGIGVLLNRGIGKPGQGIIEQRQNLLAGNVAGQPAIGGVGPAMDAISAFEQGDVGVRRKAIAGEETEKILQGKNVANIELLRRQAIEELTKENRFGDSATTGTRIENFLGDIPAFFMGSSSEEERVQAKQRQILQRRAKSAGVDINVDAPFSTEGTNDAFNTAIGQIQGAGGNWKSDDGVKAAINALPNKIGKAVGEAVKPKAPQPKPNGGNVGRVQP